MKALQRLQLGKAKGNMHSRQTQGNTRLTEQRRLILDTVRASTKHPTAETIYASLVSRLPNLSLATVYRNLHFLASRGSIREYSFEEGFLRYDPRLDLHGHFICQTCDLVTDFNLPDKICPAHFGVYQMGSVKRGRIDFYGTCTKCAFGERS